MNNILLCGFMGCGKTTVGQKLARRQAMEYLDLDAQVEADAGMPIPAIFAQRGEQGFRDLEHAAVLALAQRQNCVVSTGGGTMTFARNRSAVDSRDCCIFLDLSFEICCRRINGSDRPLLQSNTPQALRELFDRRKAAYLQAASFTVDAAPPPNQVVEAIAALLQDHL